MTEFANLTDFALDPELSEKVGAPLDLGAGRTLFVRQAGGFNRRYEHVLAMKLRDASAFEVDDELERRMIHDRVSREVAADVLLAGWSGFEDTDGEEIIFTTQRGQELLESFPTIAALVVTFAYLEENFRRQADTKSD